MEYRTYTRVGDKQTLRSEHVVERRLPSFGTDVFYATLIAFLLTTVAGIAHFEDIGKGFLAGSVVAFLVFAWRLRFVYDSTIVGDQLDEYEDVEEDEPTQPDPLIVKIYKPDGEQIRFRQPKVGEFANYIKAVIGDATNETMDFNRKTTLSQRQALARGWGREDWQNMIDQFEAEGWVIPGRNSIPEPTEFGIGVFMAYLRMLPPTRLAYVT